MLSYKLDKERCNTLQAPVSMLNVKFVTVQLEEDWTPTANFKELKEKKLFYAKHISPELMCWLVHMNLCLTGDLCSESVHFTFIKTEISGKIWNLVMIEALWLEMKKAKS